MIQKVDEKRAGFCLAPVFSIVPTDRETGTGYKNIYAMPMVTSVKEIDTTSKNNSRWITLEIMCLLDLWLQGSHGLKLSNSGLCARWSALDLLGRAIDCKADTTWKTFRDTNMTRTDKAGSPQWTAISSFLAWCWPCDQMFRLALPGHINFFCFSRNQSWHFVFLRPETCCGNACFRVQVSNKRVTLQFM